MLPHETLLGRSLALAGLKLKSLSVARTCEAMPMPRLMLVLVLLMCSLGCDGAPKRKPKKTLGQAVALTFEDWNAWTQFILKERGPRMYVLIMLTGMFALRAGEAAMLKRSDLMMDMTPPRLNIPKEKGRGKSPGQVPIMPEQLQLLRTWIDQGVTSVRRKMLNQNGAKDVRETYKIPEKGRLFAAKKKYKKKKVKRDHLSYHAVWDAVHTCARKFCTAYPSAAAKWEQLRTHSGRATKITLMMGEGIALSMSMEYARHAKNSIKTHLGYGRLTTAHVHQYLLKERAKQIGMLTDMVAKRDKGAEPVAAAAETRKRVTGKQQKGEQAEKRTKTDDPAEDILHGCSLKDIMEWYSSGKLSKEEFDKVKARLLENM